MKAIRIEIRGLPRDTSDNDLRALIGKGIYVESLLLQPSGEGRKALVIVHSIEVATKLAARVSSRTSLSVRVTDATVASQPDLTAIFRGNRSAYDELKTHGIRNLYNSAGDELKGNNK